MWALHHTQLNCYAVRKEIILIFVHAGKTKSSKIVVLWGKTKESCSYYTHYSSCHWRKGYIYLVLLSLKSSLSCVYQGKSFLYKCVYYNPHCHVFTRVRVYYASVYIIISIVMCLPGLESGDNWFHLWTFSDCPALL